MALHDLSVPIRAGMPVYEGDPPVELERVMAIEAGEEANVTGASLGLHTGTHVDAPVHYFDGRGGAESLSLEAMLGPALVVDLPEVGTGPIGPSSWTAPGSRPGPSGSS